MPPHEIIIVDSCSDDDTAMIALKYGAKLFKVNREQFDHGGTRNLSVSHSSGDTVVFLTQDALPAHGRFLESLIEPLKDPTVAAVYGRQIPRSDAALLERITREFNYPNEPARKSFEDVKRLGIKAFFFTNVCSAVRRDLFHSVGGFPEPIIVNEDMIMASRLIIKGFAVVYQPSAGVIHSHNYSLVQLFNRYFDIGVSLRANDWILGYVRAEGEGVRLLKAQYRAIRKQGRWSPALRLVADSAVKYAGYRLGLFSWALPRFLCKKLSMHKAYWRNGNVKVAKELHQHQ